MSAATVTLWRPVGPAELELIKQSGMRAFPPRLPEQPIFYPVTTEAYAIKIARDWNVPASGSGFVTCFEVAKDFSIDTRSSWPAGRLTKNTGFPPKISTPSTPLLLARSK
jgi:hypothetical protein